MSSPTRDDWVRFWGRDLAAEERRYTDALSETRAERQQRLKIAGYDLELGRERNRIALGDSEANRIYREGALEIARQEAALNRDKLALQGALGFAELGLSRERLGAETGMGLLQLRAGLKGPEDWAAYLSTGEGMQEIGPSSGFLSAIAAGQRPGVMDTAFGGPVSPATLQGLASGPTQAQQERLRNDMALASSIAGTIGKAAPGSFESLSPDRMNYFLGLAEKGGHSAKTLLSAYDQSRPGQGNPFAW